MMVNRMTNWQRSRYSGTISPKSTVTRGLKKGMTPKLMEQIARTCVTMPHWKRV